jgi:hypothetical protein
MEKHIKIIGIYKIQNKINNKCYIGSSINILTRLQKHKSLLRKNRHNNSYLQNAFNKYNESNFSMEILEICNLENLLEREQHYVNLYGDYNITKEVIRNTPSEESKLKHSKTRKELYRLGLLSKTTKSIIQYDLKGNFINNWNSITEASIKLNINPSTIIRVLKGTYKQGKGFIWRYLEDEIIPDNIDFRHKDSFVNKRSRKVIFTSDNEILEFDSLKLACIYFNTTHNNLMQYYRKKFKFKKKYFVDLVKLGEFMETPEVDNHELSTNLNG